MKAAIYSANGSPEVFRVVELPDPQPGPGEVLVAIEAISIEGGDLLARRSVAPAVPPRVKGYAAAGRVLALGEGGSRTAGSSGGPLLGHGRHSFNGGGGGSADHIRHSSSGT